MQGMVELSGKTAVVTGGGSGIGRALALAFSAEGMNVVVADVDLPAARETVELLTQATPDALAAVFSCDVSKADDVEALAEHAIAEFDAVHVLCNNAGVGGGGMLDECSLETWEWVLGVNLWGVIHGVKTFLPKLLAQNEGHIVNTASIAGHTSFPSMGPYNVSKHAVVTLSETMLAEMQQRVSDVGVSVLCPGFVATNILDSERHRPERLMDPTPVGDGAAAGGTEGDAADAPDPEAIRAMAVDAYAAQLEPEVVATLVVDAVKGGQFYIFTDDKFDTEVAARHTDIQQRRVPTSHGQLWERLF